MHSGIFSKLDSPLWLLLVEEGMFANPPQPEHDLEKKARSVFVGGLSRNIWPGWPRLFRRGIENNPHDTGNNEFFVHLDFVDAALDMPPKLAAKLLPKMNLWIDAQGLGLLLLKLGKLMRNWPRATNPSQRLPWGVRYWVSCRGLPTGTQRTFRGTLAHDSIFGITNKF